MGLSRLFATWDEKAASGKILPSADPELSQELHRLLIGQDERLLLDLRFWQWMTTVPLRSYTAARWVRDLVEKPERLAEPAVQAHYLGSASMAGFSRNAASRLYWAAAELWTEEDDYRWVNVVLGTPDFFTSLFERQLELFRPLAVEIAKVLEFASETERRKTIMNLNHVLTTVVVESLNGEQLNELVESCRP
jgi:hypothetical protein